MTTVFVGGSRHVSRLPAQATERLNNLIRSGHHVIVGDAHGVDKAVQRHLSDAGYRNVTVFCSGERSRNNLRRWCTHAVTSNASGFQFYAAKDRAMARETDFGFMIWDSKSVGTVLNVLRLVRAGKIVALINVPDKTPLNLKSPAQWEGFLAKLHPSLVADLRSRATSDEWMPLAPQ